MQMPLDAARRALELAKNEVSSVALDCLIEAMEALIKHSSDLEQRLRVLVPPPAHAVTRHGSFGIDFS